MNDAPFTPREEAMLEALRKVANVTNADEPDMQHEIAHRIATNAISAATGEPLLPDDA